MIKNWLEALRSNTYKPFHSDRDREGQPMSSLVATLEMVKSKDLTPAQEVWAERLKSGTSEGL